MPSDAFRDLVGIRLPEVRALTQLDQSRGQGTKADPLRTNAINRAASMLLSAHLQGFVEALAVEAVDWLNSEDVPRGTLPPILLAAHVEQHVDEIARQTQFANRLERIERLFSNYELYWNDCNVGPDKLEADAVTRHVSNPWPNVLRRVMRLFGGNDPFDDPSIDNPTDLEKRIKELVGKRNDIAHGSGAPPLTFQQVDAFLSAVESIARVLDEQAAVIIQDLCNMKVRPWS